jgi:hypothetical protein
MARQKYCNIFVPNELFLSSGDVVYLDRTFKSTPNFSHQYLQFTDSATYTISHFHFSYWPINIKRHYGDVFRLQYQRLQNGVKVCPTVVYADFENAIPNAVTTVWPGCEVKACRFHLGQLATKIQSLELSKQYGKRGS